MANTSAFQFQFTFSSTDMKVTHMSVRENGKDTKMLSRENLWNKLWAIDCLKYCGAKKHFFNLQKRQAKEETKSNEGKKQRRKSLCTQQCPLQRKPRSSSGNREAQAEEEGSGVKINKS